MGLVWVTTKRAGNRVVTIMKPRPCTRFTASSKKLHMLASAHLHLGICTSANLHSPAYGALIFVKLHARQVLHSPASAHLPMGLCAARICTQPPGALPRGASFVIDGDR